MSRQRAIVKDLLELFNENPIWESHSVIIKALEERTGLHWSQSTVSRALREMGAEHTIEGWNLNHAKLYQENLTELADMVGEMTDKEPVFQIRVETALLRTRSNYNRVLAKKIQDTFSGKVLSTFCPNESDMLIFYVNDDDCTFEKEMYNLLGHVYVEPEEMEESGND